MNIKLCIFKMCYIEIQKDIHGYPAKGGGVSVRNVELEYSVVILFFSMERDWQARSR